jgi:hypothetical protein
LCLHASSWYWAAYWGDLEQAYCLTNSECYTCVNGIYCWWRSYVHSENSEVILSFNIGYVRTEMFLEIQVPEYTKPACDRLALYRLSIALFTLYEMYKFLDNMVIEWEWGVEPRNSLLSLLQEARLHAHIGRIISLCWNLTMINSSSLTSVHERKRNLFLQGEPSSIDPFIQG